MHTASANKTFHDKKAHCLLLNLLAANNNGNLLSSRLQAQHPWESSRIGDLSVTFSLCCQYACLQFGGHPLYSWHTTYLLHYYRIETKKPGHHKFFYCMISMPWFLSQNKRWSRSEEKHEEDMVRYKGLEIGILTRYLMML